MGRMAVMVIMPMLSVFLVIGPLVYILYKQQKKKQLEEDGKKKHSFTKANLIRYDKRQVTNSKKACITFFVSWLVSFPMLFLELVEWMPDFVMLMIVFVFMCSGPAFLYSVYQYLASRAYLRRLEKHGYEIPNYKKDYDYLLEMLPRKQQVDESTKTDAMINKSSLILAICSFVALIALVSYNIWFLFEWYCMYDGERLVTFGVMSIVDIVLLIYCVIFFRQMDERRYKDDVEIDATRKNRMSLMEGMLIIIVLSVISFVVKDTFHSMTEYIFKSRVSTDIAMVQDIEQSFNVVYKTLSEQDCMNEWDATYGELTAGVDITKWGNPQDVFQKEIAKRLGVSDFSELQDDFHIAMGDAKVYVKLEDENFVVELLNPVDKVLEFENVIRAE